jgi:hypothetical protein
MGDTRAAVQSRLSDLLAYFHQRSLGAVYAAGRSGVPGDAATKKEGGATANGTGSVQPEKMKSRSMSIADIIQQRPPQMLSADGVEERGNPILNDHLIIPTGGLVKGKTVLESFAAPIRHRHTNTAGLHSLPCHGLLQHLYRFVGKG